MFLRSGHVLREFLDVITELDLRQCVWRPMKLFEDQQSFLNLDGRVSSSLTSN